MTTNNSARIAEIRDFLQTGAASVAVDGQHTAFDLDSLRQELRRLEEEDRAIPIRRPVCASIYLGGF
jgi:hypothetical protein